MASQKRSISSMGSLSVWLDHQGSRDGERKRRRVEAIIHEALRNIFDIHALRFEAAHIENHFMRHAAMRALIECWKMFIESRFNVIRIQDCNF